MRYYIIAGEASGDLHGSKVIKEIKQLDTTAECRVWGGDLMQAAGGEIVKHYRDLAFMGFVEVVKNLKTILGNINFCKEDILAFKPDILLLIDYPGFNLRIADWANQNNIKVHYYISPQIWAWHSSRVHKIKKIVDKMFVILPFEKAFYEQYDYEVEFVGHPLLDAVKERAKNPNFYNLYPELSDKKIIALLPGSRRQEIRALLGEMLAIIPHFPNYKFVIAGAPSMPKSYYHQVIESFNEQRILQGKSLVLDIPIIQNETYDLLEHSHAALVTSGTATLETALFNVPQVVCYKGNAISYQIAKRIVNVSYISLVNLIMDREVVKELIQENLNQTTLKEELTVILKGKKREQMLQDYALLWQNLGGVGAAKRVAEGVTK